MDLPEFAQLSSLLSRFATLADLGSLDEIAETLAADVVWEMAAGMTWTGKEAVVAGLRQMRELGHAGPQTGTRHLVTNMQFEPQSSDTVRAHSYFILISTGTAPAIKLFGEYRDTLRKVQSRWVITSRKVVT